MSLISIEFLCFCLVLVLLFYLIKGPYQWIILLVASIAFYCFCGPKYIVYILVTATTVYFTARGIEGFSKKRDAYLADHKETLGREEKKAYKADIKSRQKRLLFLCILLNVGILATLKYLDFGIAYFNYYRLMLTGNTNLVLQPMLILPLGISFYTFQSLGYVIDVYYGKVKAERQYFRFLLFVSFFPQIIQGPISRFADLEPQLFTPKRFETERIKSGLYRILFGLFKKLVIADRLSAYVTRTAAFREDYKGIYLLLCIFFYAFQIYGDFSGGIDVAIGTAELFGIRLTDNFERPFFSKSIAEYWRRWHITLGTWFRDYIFYPLSVNKRVLNLGKWCRSHLGEGVGKRVPIYLPMIAVWALTGMWHGSESKYIVWGLCNCFFLILGTEAEPFSARIMEKLHLRNDMFVMKCYRIFKTFWLMSFLRVFDFVKTPRDGFCMIRDAFIKWDTFDWHEVYTTLLFPKEEVIVAFVAIILLTVVSLIQRKGRIADRLLKKSPWIQYSTLAAFALLILIFGSYGLGYDAQSFIYMNF
ncbi:MAG: MBOAT family protein [Lachnospiraceae bacterium]|nr:MBOAT family protein [Lachnospiraceae bacterium]